jgi:hypothetical protein
MDGTTLVALIAGTALIATLLRIGWDMDHDHHDPRQKNGRP